MSLRQISAGRLKLKGEVAENPRQLEENRLSKLDCLKGGGTSFWGIELESLIKATGGRRAESVRGENANVASPNKPGHLEFTKLGK